MERVENTLEKLSLLKCADTRVGDETRRGISGGEARRLAIACEIVAGSKLLFLDEPTSGLDSSSAMNGKIGLFILIL